MYIIVQKKYLITHFTYEYMEEINLMTANYIFRESFNFDQDMRRSKISVNSIHHLFLGLLKKKLGTSSLLEIILISCVKSKME